MPIVANRPAPRISGKISFCMPSGTKTSPTSRRMRIDEAGAVVANSDAEPGADV